MKSVFYKNLIFFLIFSLASILRLKYFNDGMWADEWGSFYVSNPNLSFYKNYENIISIEGGSPLYFILLRLWHFFLGYHYEISEFFSYIFGVGLIFLLWIFSKQIFDNNYYRLFVLLLISLNPFLIYYSGEVRFYSCFVFFVILNIIFFLRFFKKNFITNKYTILYCLSSLLMISTHLFGFLVLFSQFIFVLVKKKLSLNFLFNLFVCTLIYLLLNFDYLFSLQDKYHAVKSDLSISFFIGLFFNIFFGNKILGAVIILLFYYFIFFFRKEIFLHNIGLVTFIIFLTYILPLLQSIFSGSVLRARYVIFLVPLIIVWITYFISKLPNYYIKIFLFLLITILSFYSIFFSKLPYIEKKPNLTDAYKKIYNTGVLTVYTDNDNKSYDWYENYYANTFSSKKFNINFISGSKYLEFKEFWTVCLNNPSFKTDIKADDPNCFINKFSDFFDVKYIFQSSEQVFTLYSKK